MEIRRINIEEIDNFNVTGFELTEDGYAMARSSKSVYLNENFFFYLIFFIINS